MWVGLLALVVFVAAYYTSLHRPGVQSHDGYFNWADQHSLREEAKALARADLPRTAANSDYAFGLAPASYRAQPRLWARVAPGPTTVRGSVQLLDTTPDRQGETEREQPEPDHHRQQRVAG
jgi:hypothetical protein